MNALLLLAAIPAAPVTDVKLPPGFSAHLYSDQNLANDIYTMTIDDAGRVFVAGKGYVKQLVDDDGDGKADRAVNIIANLKDGPMGLLAEADSLYVVADGGLKRYRPNQPPEVIYAVKTSGEHEAHAVRRGPDGWLYLMCGNMSGVKKEHLDPIRSPVKDPIAGSLLRISPDGKTIEAVADGFRNAYGFDFNLDGEAFTFDSDNERCVGLPWYEPCRFYHIVPGGNYGWRSPQLSQTWRKPPYFADVVPPIGVTGRGSPTGVACYRNTLFPPAYRGNFFIADWTFGKIWFVPLVKQHSSYVGKPEVFLEAVGESGFAPTSLAVHPKTGELFISIGGRGTRGAVYRIAHDRGGPVNELPMAKRSLEWNEAAGKQWVKDATQGDALTRRQALEMMLRYRDKIGWGQFLGDAVRPNLSDKDPLVRAAAGRLAVQAVAPIGKLEESLAKVTIALQEVERDPGHATLVALEILERGGTNPELQLIALRVIQLAFGDMTDSKLMGTVFEGYSFRGPVPDAPKKRVLDTLHRLVARLGDKPDRLVTIELTRTGASLGANSAELADLVEPERFDDIGFAFHGMTVLARIDAGNFTMAQRMLILVDRARQKGTVTDRNWPLRIDELAGTFFKANPLFAGDLLNLPAFGLHPDHAKLALAQHARAARKFLLVEKSDPGAFRWTPSTVSLFDAMPPAESQIVMRRLWNQVELQDAILPILSKEPKPEDGHKFLVGLRSMSPEVVKVSATALLKIEPQKDKADVVASILALRKLPEDKGSAGPREALIALLKDRTGQNHADAKSWAAWFAQAHPELAAKLNATDGFDAVAWKKREPNIPWNSGDAAKGRAVFAKATCAACHDGGGAIGPSLAGVSKRFSRDDLLTAILQPSKDVASRYRPTRLVTKDEKIHIGMIVYEAVSGVILQTGPDTVVRIDGGQIESQKLLETSLMPAGLLEKLSDAEIADLMAYLRNG